MNRNTTAKAGRRGVRLIAAGECTFTDCSDPVTDRYPGVDIPLCQRHTMLTWHHVDEDIRQQDDARSAKMEAAATAPGLVGSIYYIRVGDHIKIGHSIDLCQRMMAYPPTATLLAVHSGSRTDELNLHRIFTTSRAGGREWYRQTPEVLAHVEAMISVHGAPDPALYRTAWAPAQHLPGPRPKGFTGPVRAMS